MAHTVDGSRFEVRFEGLKLPAEVEGRIANAIQRAALAELANVDLRVKGASQVGVNLIPGWPETAGIIIRPIDIFQA